MPKLPMDYSKTIIYKIEHIENDNLVYVGHTTNWDKRKSAHKFNCNNANSSKYNLKIYQMIRENGGWNMFRMIEIEKFPCIDKRGAEKRECEVMKELKSSMNTYRSCITNEELKELKRKCDEDYREKNKLSIKARDKEYRENNKDKIKEYRDKYKEKVNCDCGCEVNKQQIRRHQTTKKHIDLMKNKI